MVFDKTGTLTEDGLQILGMMGSRGDLSQEDGKEAQFTDFVDTIKDLIPRSGPTRSQNRSVLMNEVMASCHSIT